ncbi:hypothetical protein IEO21_07134 [Rhodonia placenta]|uniref:F-box domain-containing protein n=1 Tax=Rhodonia placenta TaxID=104341 RepID=A0A8H7NYR5_9APHY|nr:hypothetical protein IEO21_07134 [Postia placenta]
MLGHLKNKHPRPDKVRGRTYRGDPRVPPPDGRCPCDKLPVELLAHIFYLGLVYLPDASEEGRSGPCPQYNAHTVKALPSEIVVSHVCSRWRNIALNTPKLWTQINLSRLIIYNKVGSYLERSQNSPVDISLRLSLFGLNDLRSPVYGKSAISSYIVQVVHGVWQLISEHISHWRSFILETINPQVMEAFIGLFNGCSPAPMLERLELVDRSEIRSFYKTRKPLRVNIFSGETPKISTIAMSGVYFDWPQKSRTQNLISLTLLHHEFATGPRYQVLARILRGSPNLKTLTLSDFTPAGDPDEEALELPSECSPDVPPSCAAMLWSQSLVELAIEGMAPELATELVGRLALPNLTRLKIDVPECYDCTDILTTLTHHMPQNDKSLLAGLTELRLKQFCGGTQEAIAAAYKAMPNLETFWFDHNETSPLWLSLLSGHNVTPHLRNLVCAGVSSPRLRTLLSKRQEWGVPLCNVTMIGASEPEVEERKWLELNTHTFVFQKDDFYQDSETDTDFTDDDREGIIFGEECYS